MNKILLITAAVFIGLFVHADTISGTVTKVFEMGEGDHSVKIRFQQKSKSIPSLFILKDNHPNFLAIHRLLKSSEDKHTKGSINTEIELTIGQVGALGVIENATGK